MYNILIELLAPRKEYTIRKRSSYYIFFGFVMRFLIRFLYVTDKKLAKQEIHYMCDNMDNWNWSSKSPFQNKYGKKRRFE